MKILKKEIIVIKYQKNRRKIRSSSKKNKYNSDKFNINLDQENDLNILYF